MALGIEDIALTSQFIIVEIVRLLYKQTNHYYQLYEHYNLGYKCTQTRQIINFLMVRQKLSTFN